jgi:uracil-DNA glycosylase
MLDPAVAPCEGCPTGATRAVATRGPVPARLLLLAGSPRFHEEHEGIAFASPAFEWLEGMLATAGLDPSQVHYATLISCRPPHQRPMRDEEIAACGERLAVTIDAVASEVVVLCGTDVVAALLPGVALSTGHGRLVVRGRRRYYPIRHPYAALHHRPYVDEVEGDLRRLAELLESGRLGVEAPLAPVDETVPPATPLTVPKAVAAEPSATEQTAPVDGAPPFAMPVIDATPDPPSPAGEGIVTLEIPPDTRVNEQETSDAVAEEDTGPAQLSLF